MAAQQKWSAAASEVLGTPVSDAVPLARRKPGSGGWMAGGIVIFAVVVFLHNFGVIPGPTLLIYLVGAIPMSFMFQLANRTVFAAQTPDGIQMINSTRWSPTPVGPPLGPVDPATVTGPHGLFRNAFDIAGVRHRTAAWQRGRFEQMLRSGGQASR